MVRVVASISIKFTAKKGSLINFRKYFLFEPLVQKTTDLMPTIGSLTLLLLIIF